MLPGILLILGGLLFAVGAPSYSVRCSSTKNKLTSTQYILPWAAASLALVLAWVCSKVTGGLRDRVLAILILGIFLIFFWGAYEQAGNVLNVWADQSTNRYLTQKAPPPQVIPKVIEDEPGEDGADERRSGSVITRIIRLLKGMVTLKPSEDENKSLAEKVEGAFNPVSTAWFQAINAWAIVFIAPIFAWLWIALDRRGLQPSIPMKMFLGLVLMSGFRLAMMMGAANQENGRSAG